MPAAGDDTWSCYKSFVTEVGTLYPYDIGKERPPTLIENFINISVKCGSLTPPPPTPSSVDYRLASSEKNSRTPGVAPSDWGQQRRKMSPLLPVSPEK